MATAEGPSRSSVQANRQRTFADMVAQSPQPIPVVEVPPCPPKIIDAKFYMLFTKEEIDRSTTPFKFSMVMKFIRQRPSLDAIHSFIRNRWGLEIKQPVISAMRRPRNIYVRFSNEPVFFKVLSREAIDVDGVPHRCFRWSLDFNEDKEPLLVPVSSSWFTLKFISGIVSHEYHCSD